MKKLILYVVLSLSMLTSFAQTKEDNVFYGKAVACTYTQEVNGSINHSDWTPITENIYVYVDWNFGISSISNKFYNRFLFLGKISEEKTPAGKLIKIKAVDQSNTLTDIHFLFKNDKTFDIKVIYTNFIYEYKVGYVEKGYPYSYLNNEKEEIKNSL